MMSHMGWYGGNWDSAPDYMKQMMQSYWGGVQPFWGFTGVLDFIIKILIVVLLIAAIRWLWKKGEK
jgi:hypothetical protein